MTPAFNAWRQQLRLALRKRLIYPLGRGLYRDRYRDTRRSILVAGTARSGTSWLGELISAQVAARIMFEPFHSGRVKDYGQFNYFHYQRPAEENPELLRYCQRVFTGAIRHPWIDREVDHLRPQYRVVKEIRANLFLKWLRRHFPEVPLVYIVRHPCAVVLSRMQLGWATDQDIQPFLSQPKLMTDFLADKLDVIRGATTPEAKHSVIWCISNLVPLRQLQADDVSVVFYERLCTEPAREIPALLRAIGLPDGNAALRRVDRPSQTTTPTSAVMRGEDKIARWTQVLSAAEVRNILDVVDHFGLSDLYDDSVLPRVTQLRLPVAP